MEEPPMTRLTPEQRQAIEKAGEAPVRVEDPDTHIAYIIIKEDVYEHLRKLLAEEDVDPSLYEFGEFEPLKK
jgi:hypothetical protein